MKIYVTVSKKCRVISGRENQGSSNRSACPVAASLSQVSQFVSCGKFHLSILFNMFSNVSSIGNSSSYES